MRAVSFQAPLEVVVDDIAEPTPGPGEALVAPRFVGLCGTDLELLEGTMPYLATGEATYPLQPGHEVAGIVVSAPPGSPEAGTPVLLHPLVGCGNCRFCRDGRQAHCPDHLAIGVRGNRPGGAAELIAMPAENLIELPPDLTLREAVLAEPGVTALNCVEATSPQPGMRALVVGAGTLGAIAAQILLSRGVEVDISILDQTRAPFVESLGANPVAEPQAKSYDLAVEYAGSPGAIRAAIEAVAPGGTIGLAGVQPAPVDGVDVNAIVLGGLTVRGPVSAEAFPAMLDLLATGVVEADLLIEREYELGDAPQAYAALGDQTRPRPKLMLAIEP